MRVGPCEKPFGNVPIIGIVSDMKVGLRGEPEPILYSPLSNNTSPVTLMLRTTTEAAAMIPTVRRAMTEVNAEIPTFSEATFADLRERQVRRERLFSDLVTLFGSVTLLVCCLGIYGLLSYSVATAIRDQRANGDWRVGAKHRDHGRSRVADTGDHRDHPRGHRRNRRDPPN